MLPLKTPHSPDERVRREASENISAYFGVSHSFSLLDLNPDGCILLTDVFVSMGIK